MSDTKPVTHEDLRKRAILWLTNTKQCTVVLSEISTPCGEIPDALGFQQHESTLVECKVSRSDFQAQKNKMHVLTGRGVGQFRYFLAPKGLLTAADVEGTDYGLLEWNGEKHGNVRVLKEAEFRQSSRDHEMIMLVSALRRVRAREFLYLVPEASNAS